MGVLPLQFVSGDSRKTLRLTGKEKISITDIKEHKAASNIKCEIEYQDGSRKNILLKSRIDTQNEMNYFKNGGILNYVLREMNA